MGTAKQTDRNRDGTLPRRTRLPAAQRQETILRAAAEAFAEAGYRATKMSDVAARVGVTEPVIFQNFGSKAALFAAVIEYAAGQVRASLDELASGSGSASGLLAHVLAGSAHRQPHGPVGAEPGPADAPYGALFADAAALAGTPELAGHVRDAVRAVAAHLADLVRHAQAEGGARADADPEAAAWLLLSVLSARRMRTAAMPPGLEPAVTALALAALAPSAAPVSGRGGNPQDAAGSEPDANPG